MIQFFGAAFAVGAPTGWAQPLVLVLVLGFGFGIVIDHSDVRRHLVDLPNVALLGLVFLRLLLIH